VSDEQALIAALKSLKAFAMQAVKDRLKQRLDERLAELEPDWEWAEIVRGLKNLEEVEAVFRRGRVVLRSHMIGQAYKGVRV
jgi:hypothetical protein